MFAKVCDFEELRDLLALRKYPVRKFSPCVMAWTQRNCLWRTFATQFALGEWDVEVPAVVDEIHYQIAQDERLLHQAALRCDWYWKSIWPQINRRCCVCMEMDGWSSVMRFPVTLSKRGDFWRLHTSAAQTGTSGIIGDNHVNGGGLPCDLTEARIITCYHRHPHRARHIASERIVSSPEDLQPLIQNCSVFEVHCKSVVIRPWRISGYTSEADHHYCISVSIKD